MMIEDDLFQLLADDFWDKATTVKLRSQISDFFTGFLFTDDIPEDYQIYLPDLILSERDII